MTRTQELGRQLRDRRIDTVGPVGALSVIAGIDDQAVVDIEQGELGRVSALTFERYCEAIGLAMDLREIHRER